MKDLGLQQGGQGIATFQEMSYYPSSVSFYPSSLGLFDTLQNVTISLPPGWRPERPPSAVHTGKGYSRNSHPSGTEHRTPFK